MGSVLSLITGPTIELAPHDIVVFVVGPSGSGKSQFINQVTASGFIKVGSKLSPCTKTVNAIRCKLTDAAKTALGPGVAKQENIVFIDTPSFNTGVADNDEIAEKEMTKWLRKSRCSSTLLGTIYIHRIGTDPRNDTVTIQDHLNTFARTFPENFGLFPKRVHAVLTHYDSVGYISKGTIKERRATFKMQLNSLKQRWDSSLHPELLQAEDRDTAWQAVATLFLPTASPPCQAED